VKSATPTSLKTIATLVVHSLYAGLVAATTLSYSPHRLTDTHLLYATLVSMCLEFLIANLQRLGGFLHMQF